jgi:hypothetical protein
VISKFAIKDLNTAAEPFGTADPPAIRSGQPAGRQLSKGG